MGINNINKTYLLGIAILVWTGVNAQNLGQFDGILKQIEQNSLSLDGYAKANEARKIGARTGLSPENPEVEVGVLPGTHGGIRKDFAVSQSFDFPTLYSKRGKLADAQNISSDWQLRSERMELLLAAEQYCIELVYNNSMAALYTRQVANAKEVAEAYKKKLERGDATQLEYNKAMLNLINIQNDLKAINLEQCQLQSQLTLMNGGNEVNLSDSDYTDEATLPADFNQWAEEAVNANPSFAFLRQEVEVAKCGVGVSKAQGLPKLSVGYAGEFTSTEGWQGVKVGVSIPLWENRNRVKHARAEVVAAEQTEIDSRLKYTARLRYLFDQANELTASIKSYENYFYANRNEELLYKALQGGEISLLEYLLELEYYFNSYERLMQTRRDLQLTLAELYAYKL